MSDTGERDERRMTLDELTSVEYGGMEAGERAFKLIYALIGDIGVLTPVGRRLTMIQDNILTGINDRNDARRERDAALALAERRAVALRRIEWVPEPQTGGMRFCPACEQWEGRGARRRLPARRCPCRRAATGHRGRWGRGGLMATDEMTPQGRIDRCADDMARAFALTLASAQDAARAMVALGPIIDAVLREAGVPLGDEGAKGGEGDGG